MTLDKKVSEAMEKLKGHYDVFINNNFIKTYLLASQIPKNDWIDIEDLVNYKQYYEKEGYDLSKIYDQILTFCSFLLKIERDIIPKMRDGSEAKMSKMSQDNKVLFQMTLRNIPGNLKIFYDLVRDLFLRVKQLDRTDNGEALMIYNRISYLKEIEKTLGI